MTYLLIAIAVIVVVLLVYLVTLDGEYTVDRHLQIDAPVDRVFATIVDFKSWTDWSPWLLHEPETRLEYSDNYDQEQGYYSWDGEMVGAGKLTHVAIQPNQSIEQRIEFIRPFKAVSRVAWSFAEADGQTDVHWIMQGKMPFLFRPMTEMTRQMVAKDYDLGLHLLNGYLNPDSAHPRFEFIGSEEVKGFDYAYVSFSGYMQAMVSAMQEGFPRLKEQTQQKNIIDGYPLTLYHKADPKKGYFECDMAIPVKPAADYAEIKSFAGGRYYKMRMLGDYQFLELAWYKIFSHVRMLKLKLDMQRPSLEIYENDPLSITHSNEVSTCLYLPIK